MISQRRATVVSCCVFLRLSSSFSVFSLYSLMMCNMQSVVPRVPSRRVYNDWYDPGCRSRACARTLLLVSSSWYVLLQTWCTRSRYAVVPGKLLSANCVSLCRFYAGLASIWQRLDDAATGKREMCILLLIVRLCCLHGGWRFRIKLSRCKRCFLRKWISRDEPRIKYNSMRQRYAAERFIALIENRLRR